MAIVSGWAAVDADGDINVKTVSGTRRAAIVNWLVVGAGIMVLNHWSDEGIEETFQKQRTRHRVDVVPVTIRTREPE